METDLPVVSLVGYTSSGKTTLFNLLTESNKEISADLFTTLSTTTRSLKINANNDNTKVLLVDTVGFISRLPHYMIDAFKSTLEESLGADLILLLIDSSETIEEITKNLELSNPMVISSKGGYGIRKFKTMIGQALLSHHNYSAIMTRNRSR